MSCSIGFESDFGIIVEAKVFTRILITTDLIKVSLPPKDRVLAFNQSRAFHTIPVKYSKYKVFECTIKIGMPRYINGKNQR